MTDDEAGVNSEVDVQILIFRRAIVPADKAMG